MFEYLRFFQYAFVGLRYTLKNHKSFALQSVAALIALVFAVVFRITRIEWIILIVTIGGVLTAELFNTAAESILDYLEKKHNLNVRIAKDVAAAGVLVTAIVSIIVGVLIFGPYIVGLYN